MALFIRHFLTYVFLYHPETVPVRTVNRQCSSGLQAVADVAASIRAGFYDIGKGCIDFFFLFN